MIRNYLKIAVRTLLKNKGFTFINILGLALGLAICLLIIFFVVDELSYDRYNTKCENIYRVNTDLKYNGTVSYFAGSPIPLADALMREFPEVEKAVRITPAVNIRFKKGNETVREDGATFYCENGIFDIFTFPMLSGNPKTALTEPNAVVITESMAKKYFNRTNVVGETLFLITDSSNHKVTGVMRDMPQQSHFKINFLLASFPVGKGNWNSISPFKTYILLKPGTDQKRFEAKLNPLMDRNLVHTDFDYKKFKSSSNYFKLSLIPLKDIHLQSNRQGELGINGNIQHIYIFSAVAIFILLLACINFMNLSTARSANRAREVGVRKVLGSSRRHLVFQFLAESLIVTFVAALIAVLTAWALLPLFNHFSNKELSITPQTLSWLLPALLIIVLFVGILAGSYPAFFLSAFQPVDVLKGKLSAGFKGGTLRSTLVVFQFSISIFLIIGTLVIYNQLHYIQNKDLGFKRSQVLTINSVNTLNNTKLFKQQIKQLPGVVNATLTSYLPVGGYRSIGFISTDQNNGQSTQLWKVDEDYLNTMGIELKSGRGFSAQFKTDSTAVVINETAAKILGYHGDPVNQSLYTGVGNDVKKKYIVIGVVKDFNFSSLRDNVEPLVMVMENDWLARLSVRVNTHNLPAMLAQIEATWKTTAPHEHFEYSFMDADFDALYRTEQRMGNLFVTFTTLAVFIACLGLFSLAAYAAEQRNKEIGIRKILGAGVSTIITMLSKDFIKLVFISIIIATPLAWLIMNKWLQGYAYRQNIQWWMLLSAAAGALVIAFVTISSQSFKAARSNPVDSLRSE
ncbi:ABC transporter permease [Mucilaginibacter sp. 22184]|uniref:ABC transporter permease n=1 Tax=Mucilaginibacter sp. 22184 TaxID=3453887 RepID=UPI003F866E20